MFTFPGISREVFVVEVQYELVWFEAKLLVEQHGRVGGGAVQRHILPHACLVDNTLINMW